MGLEVVVNINDFVTTNPTGSDPKSAGDDHLRYIKTALKNDFAGFTGAVIVTGVDGGAADAYTLTPTHAVVAYTTKMLVEFTPAATNTTTTPTLNISALGAKTIKSVANAALVAGDLVISVPTLLAYDGTNLRLLGPTKNYIDQLAFSTALPAQSLGLLRSDGSTAAFTQTTTGFALNAVKGADIASAATINLTTATGEFVHVTGTTTITAITIPVGAERVVIFDGSLTLTHAASLLLPGGASITTAANDRMVVRGDTAGATVIVYMRANNKGTDIASAATINLTTATGDFVHVTGTTTITAITIPIGVERTVIFDGILTLTHGAALLLPGAVSITTAANDRMIVRGDTAGAIVISYTRDNGLPVSGGVDLLASATVSSPVANIDFLTTFSSSFDKYTIELEGIVIAAAGGGINLRVAVAGVVDSGANMYATMAVDTDGVVNSFTTTATLYGSLATDTRGGSVTVEITNANATATVKGITARGVALTSTGKFSVGRSGGYVGTNVVSGFRIYSASGTNISAGTVRVYGHRNS